MEIVCSNPQSDWHPMIHYHGTPITGGDKNAIVLKHRHAMVSLASAECLPVYAEICQSFALDNGAFSAWTQSKQLDVVGFWEWVETWRKHPGFDWCLIPDVIDGGEAENDSMLADAPSRHWCVPVWHLHESIDRLQKLAADWPRVALGSSGQFSSPGSDSWWRRMAEAIPAVCDEDGRPLVKLHGLRMLDTSITSVIPLASADSTNVARNAGLDCRWTGPYVPPSVTARAAVIIDRIESHASASRWTGMVIRNWELFG